MPEPRLLISKVSEPQTEYYHRSNSFHSSRPLSVDHIPAVSGKLFHLVRLISSQPQALQMSVHFAGIRFHHVFHPETAQPNPITSFIHFDMSSPHSTNFQHFLSLSSVTTPFLWLPLHNAVTCACITYIPITKTGPSHSLLGCFAIITWSSTPASPQP